MRGWSRRLGLGLLGLLVLVNGLAAMHARSFLFFGPPGVRTPSPESISVVEAASVLVLGPTLPRPQNRTDPRVAMGREFSTQWVRVGEHLSLSLWTIEPDPTPRGTVVLLHGYGGSRDQLLGVARFFWVRDWRVVLLDQRGAGDSEGDHTTLGYREGDDLAQVVEVLRPELDGPLVAYGFSMGAVAALGAAGRHQAPLDAVIAEAPYSSLVDTIGQRFVILGLPPSPGAELLTFWGSVWAGFWAFDMRPAEDARHITVPTLVVSGTEDRRAPPAQGAEIVANLGAHGTHLVLEGTGHQLGLETQPLQWTAAVEALLDGVVR